MERWLLVGLGNPGSKYERHRHNVGFMVVDQLAQSAGASLAKGKFKGETGSIIMDARSVLLLKPLTFMNLSGTCIGAFASYYRISIDKLLVIHDDLDLPFGRVRVKSGGGHGGHNGLRNIMGILGAADFLRIRIGIGRPGPKEDVTGHVLGGFSKEEEAFLPDVLDRAVQAARLVVLKGTREAMNVINACKEDGFGPSHD